MCIRDSSITGKDKRWGEIVMDSLFLGMVSAFVGMLFADFRSGLPGLIPIAVAVASALLMAVCGVLIKVCKWSWLEQYAPVSYTHLDVYKRQIECETCGRMIIQM